MSRNDKTLNLMVVLVSCFLSLSLAEAVIADGLYRWVDEKGVTHFSAVPPADPDQAKNIQEEQMPGARAGNRSRRIDGTWWDSSPYSGATFITFSNGKFSMGDKYVGNSGLSQTVVARGPYAVQGNTLEITYFSHVRDAGLVDKTRRYTITTLTDSELHLLHDSELRPRIYRRLTKTPVNPMSARLYGSWRDSRHALVRYKFDHGTFDIVSENGLGQSRTVKSANWSWEEPVIQISYVFDISSSMSSRKPAREEWMLIDDSGGNEIKMKDIVSGEFFTLFRHR